MRALDRLAIAEDGMTGFALMTKAGQFMFDSIRQSCPDAKSMLIFCGVGNNAGDGYIIARLAIAANIAVSVIQLGDHCLQQDALTAQQQYIAAGGVVMRFDVTKTIDYQADIVVDALLGTGITRDVVGVWAQAVDVINNSDAYIAAVDIPSGLNADTGTVMGCAVVADETVTFIARKQGLYTGKARDVVGKLSFADLGVRDELKKQLNTHEDQKEIFLLSQHIPRLPPRNRSSHKGSHGHVLLVGGVSGMSGAIKMAAEAALTVGAGLVTVITHPEHAAWLNITRPELMVKGVDSAKQLTPYLQRADVVAIGPGLGTSAWGQALFYACLATSHDKIIDADALNLLAKLSIKKDNWILTPHAGEAARLLGVSVKNIESDRFKAVSQLQANFSGLCVLKGAGSLLAEQHKIAILTLGNPGMAVAGMGDILTGVIAGLRAQGASLKTSLRLGVTLHATAADRAVAEKGERGLFATDLYPYLRELVN